MKFTSLPNEPVTKAFSRQNELYEKADQDSNFVAQLPFASNFSHFLNVEACSAAGIDALGLARQMDQVLIENLGNNISSKAKAAAKAGKPLPGQSEVDDLIAAYDFTGLRSVSEDSMSTEERTYLSEIKKELRRSITQLGYLTDLPGSAFSVTRIATQKEADGEKESPAGTLALDEFESFVSAAHQAALVTISDDKGNSVTVDFSAEPEFNEHGQPTNWSGIAEIGRREAARTIERNRTPAAPPKPMALTA